MKVLQPKTARPLFRSSPDSSDSLHLLHQYLQSSDASLCQQSDLDHAVQQVTPQAVVDFYTGLIRSTFALKIEPALKSVVLTSNTLPSIIASLADGLNRYQACWKRLHLDEYDDVVVTTFQALVRQALHEAGLVDVLQQCLDAILDTPTKVVSFYRLCNQIGIGRLCQHIIKKQLFSSIDSSICTKCTGNWDKRFLDALSSRNISDACTLLAECNVAVSGDVLANLERDSLAKIRIAELFDIIVDYPVSLPALEDLRHCLQGQPGLRSLLVASYIDQCSKRLLHPGANTVDIIFIYVSTIKTFTLLDPPGVLLDKVARPIRKYLRERGDTIRCIMTSLLNEADELSAELNTTAAEIQDDENDLYWEPTPVDASPDYMRRTRDLLDSLTSIYEHRDVFVKELQVLLADRLLATSGYKIEGELHNLELLKRRFKGAALMSSADVMVKDIIDSEDIDGQIQEKSTGIVHATILSRLYWPKQSLPNLNAVLAQSQDQATKQVPGPVRDMLSKYTDVYGELKPNRTLRFLPNLGHVRVELQLEDREFDLLVTPGHASVIYAFSDVAERTVEQLMKSLDLVESELRRALVFWTKQGILRESQPGVFSVVESVSQTTEDVVVEDIALDAVEVPADDDMDMYWQFIVGMLTNVGALPLERIQSMLGMFAPSYDRPAEELGTFLAKKMREGAVQLKGGQYKLA